MDFATKLTVLAEQLTVALSYHAHKTKQKLDLLQTCCLYANTTHKQEVKEILTYHRCSYGKLVTPPSHVLNHDADVQSSTALHKIALLWRLLDLHGNISVHFSVQPFLQSGYRILLTVLPSQRTWIHGEDHADRWLLQCNRR